VISPEELHWFMQGQAEARAQIAAAEALLTAFHLLLAEGSSGTIEQKGEDG